MFKINSNKMSEIKGHIKIMIIFIIIIYGIITPLTYLIGTDSRETLLKVRLEEFSGIVIRKYDVEVEHHAPYIDIVLDNKEIKSIGLLNYNSDVFNKVQVGDTIYTKSGEISVHIHRKDTSFMIQKPEILN